MAIQLPVNKWFGVIGDTTIADAIMDQVIHRSHKLELNSKHMAESMRAKTRGVVKKSN